MALAGRVWSQLGLLSQQGLQARHLAGIAARCVLDTRAGLTQAAPPSTPRPPPLGMWSKSQAPPCMTLVLPTVGLGVGHICSLPHPGVSECLRDEKHLLWVPSHSEQVSGAGRGSTRPVVLSPAQYEWRLGLAALGMA